MASTPRYWNSSIGRYSQLGSPLTAWKVVCSTGPTRPSAATTAQTANTARLATMTTTSCRMRLTACHHPNHGSHRNDRAAEKNGLSRRHPGAPERTRQQATMAVEPRNGISRKPRFTAWAARRLLRWPACKAWWADLCWRHRALAAPPAIAAGSAITGRAVTAGSGRHAPVGKPRGDNSSAFGSWPDRVSGLDELCWSISPWDRLERLRPGAGGNPPWGMSGSVVCCSIGGCSPRQPGG